MALVDTEGFGLSTALADFYTYGVFSTAISANAPVGSSIFSTGGPGNDPYLSVSANTTDSSVGRYLPRDYSSFYTGQYAAATNNSSLYFGFLFEYLDRASGSSQFSLQLDGRDNLIHVFTGNQVTQIGVSAANAYPTDGSWFFLEVFATISTTVGAIIVRVNGAVVINISNVNTQYVVGSSTVGAVQWLTANGKGIAAFYFCDTTGPAPWNTFLGPVRVATVRPAANDAVAFTPVGQAANYLNAAEYPPVPGTDYNQDTTVGAQDTFTQPGLPVGGWSVLGVSAKELFAVGAAGSRSVAGLLKSGTSVALGTTRTIASTTAAVVVDIFETDPATSAQWTVAAATAAKNGYRIIA